MLLSTKSLIHLPLFFLSMVILTPESHAQVPTDVTEIAIELRDDAMRGTRAGNIVESLTTEVGPRLAGTEQETRARDWAVEQLAAMGFENVRIEPFMIDGWERGREVAEVLAPFPQKLSIASLGNSVATSESGVEGELVLFRTLDDLQRAPHTGLEGKIVYVGHAMQKTQDGSSYGHFVRLRSEGAVEAGRRGASPRSAGPREREFKRPP